MATSQMLKGIIDGCILTIISRKEVYGYEIAELLATYGFDSMSEGTIYPILLRLQKEELVTSKRKKSTAGPKRKYYYISDKGVKELKEFTLRWESLKINVTNVLDNRKEQEK
ncbi:MAG TPA: PadR family transcriptional regulator [Pseudogracilibacillus sp.]|nr:PadR family transcriptional regulator [Pseudogracilibacillus sp.]